MIGLLSDSSLNVLSPGSFLGNVGGPGVGDRPLHSGSDLSCSPVRAGGHTTWHCQPLPRLLSHGLTDHPRLPRCGSHQLLYGENTRGKGEGNIRGKGERIPEEKVREYQRKR